MVPRAPYPTLDEATVAAIRPGPRTGATALVIAHIGTRKDAEGALRAGVDGLAHVFVDAPPGDDFATLAADRRAFVIPTLGVLSVVTGDPRAASSADQEPAFVGELDASDRQHLSAHFPLTPPGAKSPMRRTPCAVCAPRTSPCSPGPTRSTRGSSTGASLHRELELLVHAGLSPSEALSAATFVPAACFAWTTAGASLRAFGPTSSSSTATPRATSSPRGAS